jgi:hypothetical protein
MGMGIGFCFVLFPILARAQLGGLSPFPYLNLPVSARSAALGGVTPSLGRGDGLSFYYNPAGADTANSITAGYNPYTRLARYSVLAGQLKRWGGTSSIGIQNVSYGDLTSYSETGQVLGTFSASSFGLTLNHSRPIGPFRAGASLKLSTTAIDTYRATGISADIGIQYLHPREDLQVGLAFQHIGVVADRLLDSGSRAMPLNIVLGAAYRFPHMPMRLLLNLQQLQRYDLVYLDPTYSTRPDDNGTTVPLEKKTSEKIARHFSFGVEVLLSKAIHLRGGYNHLIRKEMKLPNSSAGAAGYSLGAHIAFRNFGFDYAHSFVSQASGADHINLAYRFQ